MLDSRSCQRGLETIYLSFSTDVKKTKANRAVFLVIILMEAVYTNREVGFSDKTYSGQSRAVCTQILKAQFPKSFQRTVSMELIIFFIMLR